MTGQFIGYALSDDHQESVPVSVGATKDDAMASAIRRVLSLGITNGEISVQQKDDLAAGDFATLKDVLDRWFAEKGMQ